MTKEKLHTESDEAKKWGEYHEQKQKWKEQASEYERCSECGGKIVKDFNKCEAYCIVCGLIVDSEEYKPSLKYLKGGF